MCIFVDHFQWERYLLVTIDAYSRFSEAEIVNSTAAKGTISKLDQIFEMHGIPRVHVSDNGPSFLEMSLNTT